jgi:hypothetical protein
MSDLVMQVLGQVEGLTFQHIEIGNRHSLVTMKLTGPDGDAYATMTHGMAENLIDALKEQLRELDGD